MVNGSDFYEAILAKKWTLFLEDRIQKSTLKAGFVYLRGIKGQKKTQKVSFRLVQIMLTKLRQSIGVSILLNEDKFQKKIIYLSLLSSHI